MEDDPFKYFDGQASYLNQIDSNPFPVFSSQSQLMDLAGSMGMGGECGGGRDEGLGFWESPSLNEEQSGEGSNNDVHI